MAESTRLVDLVQSAIDDFLDDRAVELESIAKDLRPLVDYSRDLLRGGKRFRALFCYWGWQAVRARPSELDPLGDDALAADLDVIVRAASALELFHAAALVHDDIMDNSDTRRGMSAAHRRFEERHREAGWVGDPAEFGRSSAMLLGDLLLSWSEQLFDLGLQRLESPSDGAAARTEFNRMRTEVMVGQYLDILEEQAWRGHDERELLPRAHRVIVYKSAKYSIEAPLAIGAALGGATESQVASLRDFGLPLGIAYQLRDDLLGVFGDPDVTGKPSGDDLREGKRTVLIAIARSGLPTSARRFLDEMLGDRELDDSQVRMLQAAIRDSGAVDQVERIIENNVTRARTALDSADISPSAQRQLLSLVETVTKRSA
ncbi:polyprenyl synthetase family protein [Cryobacterium sp. BB736]|uniref:polyprenyl synthetase family protein n=1 Tax=Cryobacterium sp. BB736 TaxID=2746963 RepID=UPI001877049A